MIESSHELTIQLELITVEAVTDIFAGSPCVFHML
jgi:hypothetical protein